MDPIAEVKVRAELLQHRGERGDPEALARLAQLDRRAQPPKPARGSSPASPEFPASPESAAPEIRRKHCLSVVARELGFTDYAHLLRVVEGDPSETDFGTLPCGRAGGAHLNAWYPRYEGAKADHQPGSGYLLAYRRHFVIVGDAYIRDVVGIDPAHPDWRAIGYDWPRPTDLAARRRLYGLLFVQAPRQALRQAPRQAPRPAPRQGG